jgi:ArsR family transcriptional regulator, lead/cadmium/zinc/bismuth-responsive transcriptional repressor
MVELASRQTVELAETFRLLGDVTRLRIVLACSDGAVCVGDIAAKLGQSPSLVSHHLRLLRGQRLVRAERRGKQIFYCLADAHVERVIADMRQHIDEAVAEFRAA